MKEVRYEGDMKEVSSRKRERKTLLMLGLLLYRTLFEPSFDTARPGVIVKNANWANV